MAEPNNTEKLSRHYSAPLEVKIEKGALVVRIGIETLAHAVTYSDWANPYEESTGDYIRNFAIVDAPQFASDVLHDWCAITIRGAESVKRCFRCFDAYYEARRQN